MLVDEVGVDVEVVVEDRVVAGDDVEIDAEVEDVGLLGPLTVPMLVVEPRPPTVLGGLAG